MSILISKIIEKIKNPYIVFEKNSNKLIYSNQKAKDFIGDIDGEIDINEVFKSLEFVDKFIKNEINSEISDIQIKQLRAQNMILVNLFLGYFDESKTQIYVEIQEKTDLTKIFGAMQELSEDILFLINIKKRLLFFRGELSKQIGIPNDVINFPQALVENNLIHPDDIDTYLVSSEDMLIGIRRSCDVRIKMITGEFNWFSMTSVIVRDDNDEPIRVIGKLKNIQKDKDIEFKMSHDILTKTLNKISFINCVSEILHSSDEEVEKHALYFVDIDNFTKANQEFTTAFGDELIKHIANQLRGSIRDTDFVGRVGIDEFVIFIPNIDCDEAIENKANFILSKIDNEFVYEDKKYQPSVSIGVAKFPIHGKTYNELQKKADIALYSSKEKGKHRTTIFNEELG